MGTMQKVKRQVQPNFALIGLSLTMLMPSLATSTANVALPQLAKAFSAPFHAAQWAVLSYLLTITALTVVAGRLGDIVGRRRLLLSGIAVFTAGSLLSGVAPNLEFLVAARVVQGIGASVMMTLTMAFVAAVVPQERTGSAMGLLGTMSAVGTTLGPALGGLLIAAAGPKAIFFVNIPIAAVTLLALRCALPDDGSRPSFGSGSFDGTGMGLLIVSLVAYAMAVTLGGSRLGLHNLAMISVAIFMAAAFIAIEVKASSPLIRLDILRDPLLLAGFSIGAIVSTVMMATLIVGPFYLARVVGLGPATAGFALAIGPLVAAGTGVPAGWLVDRHGTAGATLFGLSILGAGTAALAVFPSSLGLAGYVVPIVAMTAGYGLCQTANNAAVMNTANSGERGLISGMLGLSRNLGLVTGASVMGSVFAWGSGTNDVVTAGAESVAAGARTAFGVATVFVAIALVIAFLVTRRPPGELRST